jgi:hypothetical protein
VPRWADLQAGTRAACLSAGRGLADELPADRRIVSPSDFGFHNALVEAGGGVRFFDFEYAGWDDPAKTLCDFFCQIAVPVPADWSSEFAAAVEELPEAGGVRQRATWLMPVYRLKWCCIVLNPLVAEGRRRRAFSRGGAAAAEPSSELACLDKAGRILENIGRDEIRF